MTGTRDFPPLSDDLDHSYTFAVVSLSLNMLQMFTVVDMKPAASLTWVKPIETSRVTAAQSHAGQQRWKCKHGF